MLAAFDFGLDTFLLLVGIHILWSQTGQWNALMGSFIVGCSILNLYLDVKRHRRGGE